MIRVLVAEDSATSRALLVALLGAEQDMTVVGEATTGREAVEMAKRLAPDIVTMDVQMPELDGLEATREIMMYTPRPIIIVSATARTDEVALSLEAIRAGALLVLPKPEGPNSPTFAADTRQLVSMVRAMSSVKVVRRHAGGSDVGTRRRAQATRVRTASPKQLRLVAIAASTGGPAAVRDILAALPRAFPLPVLLTQHIAHGFTAGLAQWLNGDTPLSVQVAQLGELALPGTVYIAAEDRHLGCRTDATGALRIALDDAPHIGSFRPSATYMFRSCAAALGADVLAVILTGMGDDGVAGLRDVRAAGGHIIAQDEASSVIFGMPREAARAGIVDEVVALIDMPRRIEELVA